MWRVCVERPLPSGSCGTAIGRLFVPIISHESNLYPQLIQDTNTKPTKKRSPKSRVWLFAFQPVNVPPSLLAPPSTNVIPDYFSIPTPPSNFTPSHIQVDDQEVEIEQQPQQQPQQQQQQQSLVLQLHPPTSAAFSLVRRLGAGGFGAVFQVQSQIDQKHYALKRVILSQDFEDNDALLEAECHSVVSNHPNICSYHASWIEPVQSSPATTWDTASSSQLSDASSQSCSVSVDTLSNTSSTSASVQGSSALLLLLEHCDGCTLREWMQVTPPGNQRIRSGLSIFKQLLQAVNHVHQHKWIHGDISPPNVFISGCGSEGDPPIVKLGDFGLAREISCEEPFTQRNYAKAGAWLYAAPEVRAAKGNNNDNDNTSTTPLLASTTSDTFSLGVLLLEMLLGPFTTTMERVAVLEQAQHGAIDAQQQQQQYPQQQQQEPNTKEMWDTIQRMIHPNALMRPSCELLLQSPLCEEIDVCL